MIVKVANVAALNLGKILILQLHRRSIVEPIVWDQNFETVGAGGSFTSSIVRTGQYSKSSSRSKDLAAS